jgi:beta-N-acetylhexosaminidase
MNVRGISSAGRAIGSQSIGQGFESPILHTVLLIAASFLAVTLGSCKTTPPETSRTATPPSGTKNARPSDLPKWEPPETSLEQRKPQKKITEVKRTDLPAVQEDLVMTLLAKLSLQQQIGQRFLTWMPGTTAGKKAREIVLDNFVAGVILTTQNVSDRVQVKELTTALQKIAQEGKPAISLFIGVDQEGGRIARFRFKQTVVFPAAFYVAEHNDDDFVESAAYITGRELADLGCNMNFAPVLDVYGIPDDTIIGDRSMGWKSERVGQLGKAYLSGAARAGIIPVIKHFPGHGITTVDSHLELPLVDGGRDVAFERHLMPFRMAIAGGAEVLMTAHILYTGIDRENPVPLSSSVIQGVLRNELGFDGVVISDAIDVRALTRKFSASEIVRRAFKAGVDLLLVTDVFSVTDLKAEVLKLLSSGQLTKDDIAHGVLRVLRLKLRYGLASL